MIFLIIMELITWSLTSPLERRITCHLKAQTEELNNHFNVEHYIQEYFTCLFNSKSHKTSRLFASFGYPNTGCISDPWVKPLDACREESNNLMMHQTQVCSRTAGVKTFLMRRSLVLVEFALHLDSPTVVNIKQELSIALFPSN